jgi:hypothetical protein
MTQSKKEESTVTVTINSDNTIDISDISTNSSWSSDCSFDSMDTSYTLSDTSNIDIDSITINTDFATEYNNTFNWNDVYIGRKLWQDTLPDVETVNKMCEEYPALAKAYENFKTVYKLVEQDYKGNHDDEDEFPF